jgi:hypothetical protein
MVECGCDDGSTDVSGSGSNEARQGNAVGVNDVRKREGDEKVDEYGKRR